MGRIVFCSFADSRFSASINRIRKHALQMSIYDDIYVMTETDLTFDFVKKNKDKLRTGSRGYGYWVWKPQVIKQVFDNIAEGDVVHYADVGCWLNPKGRSRMLEYIDKVEQSFSGLLGFRVPEARPPELETFSFLEKTWTKGDLFDYFRVREDPDVYCTEQFIATTFLMRKNKKTERFIEDWKKVWDEGFYLIDDTPSISRNFNGFIEHRHDQSAFSILMKLSNAESIDYLEVEKPIPSSLNRLKNGLFAYDVDWKKLNSYPVQARRDKDLGVFKKYVIKVNNLLVKLKVFGLSKKWGPK